MNSLPVVILSTRRAAAVLACVSALLSGCTGPATVTATGTVLGTSSSQTIDAPGDSITSPDDLHLVMGRFVQLCGGPIIFTTPPAISIRGLSPC